MFKKIQAPSLLRSNDWWEPKIIPLLVVGYLTILFCDENIIAHIGWLLFLIAAIATGAVYVSILNDFTDLKFDLASGKANRLEKFSPLKRKLLLLGSIILAVVFCLFFVKDRLSLTFYLAAYAAFSLYSIAPFRLKNRGVLGVIADASGAHLFPSLFIVASMTHKMGTEINFYWLMLIGIWSFSYGLRGILWHQFWDRENDLSINHKTFATSMRVSKMVPVERIITIIEICALVLILLVLRELLPFVAILFYILVLFGYRKLKHKIIFILSKDGLWHIFMSDYYQILLPFSLIITCSFQYPFCSILLVVHLLLFPVKIKLFIRNLLLMMHLKK